jgi:hypothetical protein
MFFFATPSKDNRQRVLLNGEQSHPISPTRIRSGLSHSLLEEKGKTRSQRPPLCDEIRFGLGMGMGRNGKTVTPRLPAVSKNVFVSDYSYRSATIGSTFEAWRAGK